MKVAIELGVNPSLDAVRGIGVHTNTLIKELGKLERNELTIVSDPKNADVTHYTKFNPFFISLPFFKPSKKVVITIHDLIPLIYPKHYPPGIRGRMFFLINKHLVKKNVDAIITISETSKKDIVRFLGIAPRKIHVIYLAPRKIFRRMEDGRWKTEITKRYGLPESFALYVGDVNYNKNIPGLIEMCKDAGIKLVIAGKQAKEIEKLDLDHPELSHLKGLDWTNVIRLGFVPDEDLVGLYNLADVYIQPSLYEGFALPLLEAKACGTWVIATRIPTHVEILGRGRKYSWEATAKETLNVYKNC